MSLVIYWAVVENRDSEPIAIFKLKNDAIDWQLVERYGFLVIEYKIEIK